jgi:hypothetical protein
MTGWWKLCIIASGKLGSWGKSELPLSQTQSSCQCLAVESPGPQDYVNGVKNSSFLWEGPGLPFIWHLTLDEHMSLHFIPSSLMPISGTDKNHKGQVSPLSCCSPLLFFFFNKWGSILKHTAKDWRSVRIFPPELTYWTQHTDQLVLLWDNKGSRQSPGCPKESAGL